MRIRPASLRPALLSGLVPGLCALALSAPATAATLEPPAVSPSSLTVSLDFVGQFATAGNQNNVASPIAIGDHLYVVDQKRGKITIQDGASSRNVLELTDVPPDVTPVGKSGFMNMAGDGGPVAYVGFTSSTLPAGFGTAQALPNDPNYHQPEKHYQLIYAYDRAADGSLSNPRALTAFETGQSTRQGGAHFGEAMLVLPDGRLLLSRGDNLNQLYDGLTHAQDPTSTVAKLLIIDGQTGATQVAATGVRNVQQLSYTDASRTRIAFSDIGRTVAEEINVIDVADLVDTAEVENFGWGRNADGLNREGTFYVNQGDFMGEVPGATGAIPGEEPGFITPYAQFGREGAPWLAVSGPILSEVSFNMIDMLFGDLATGALYATMEGIGDTLNTVYSVGVADGFGGVTTLADYLGITRADLRFFNFTDGSAGVLLERTGMAYRITEVVTAVPLPASALLLLGGLGLMATRRRRLV